MQPQHGVHLLAWLLNLTQRCSTCAGSPARSVAPAVSVQTHAYVDPATAPVAAGTCTSFHAFLPPCPSVSVQASVSVADWILPFASEAVGACTSLHAFLLPCLHSLMRAATYFRCVPGRAAGLTSPAGPVSPLQPVRTVMSQRPGAVPLLFYLERYKGTA